MPPNFIFFLSKAKQIKFLIPHSSAPIFVRVIAITENPICWVELKNKLNSSASFDCNNDENYKTGARTSLF